MHRMLIRGSMARAKPLYSTSPTGLHGKKSIFLRSRAACTRQAFIRKTSLLGAWRIISCLFKKAYKRNRKAWSSASRPPCSGRPRNCLIRLASRTVNLSQASESASIAFSRPYFFYSLKPQTVMGQPAFAQIGYKINQLLLGQILNIFHLWHNTSLHKYFIYYLAK